MKAIRAWSSEFLYLPHTRYNPQCITPNRQEGALMTRRYNNLFQKFLSLLLKTKHSRVIISPLFKYYFILNSIICIFNFHKYVVFALVSYYMRSNVISMPYNVIQCCQKEEQSPLES